MTIILYGLMIIVLYHLIYEGIVAPSLRQELRLELLVLQGELDLMKARGVQRADLRAFAIVSEGVEFWLDRLTSISITNTIAAERKYSKNPGLRESVRKRKEVLDNSSQEIRDARRDLVNIFRRAYLVNGAGWWIYLFPLAQCVVMARRIREWSGSIVTFPRKDVQAVIATA